MGTIFYLGIVQFPAMQRNGSWNLPPESVSKLNSTLVFTSISNVVAGVSMVLIISRLDTGIFTSTIWGFSILLGGLLTLAGLVITFAGLVPALERLSASALSDVERRAFLGKARTLSNIVIVLGTIVLLMMATAGSL